MGFFGELMIEQRGEIIMTEYQGHIEMKKKD